MEISELYEMQKELDAKIIKEKGLEGVDLLPNTVLALQVEIGELANEWRGFKHWSNRQTPKMYPLEECSYCGEAVEFTRPTPFMADAGADMCKYCWDMTQKEYAASNDQHIPNFEDYPHFPKKTPQKLLKEYADCLHFFLSIARQLDLPADDLYAFEYELEYDTTIVFSELLHNVGLILVDNMLVGAISDVKAYRRAYFRSALFIFYALGEQRLGFTWEQITRAYVQKNKVNHERQANGY